MKIFLIGFMGSGKTYWGKIWAEKKSLQFFDLDAVIESQENRTIAKIFEDNGENWFRQLETKILHSFSDKKNCIIATGGGTACFNHNMEWMNQNGITIYIDASVDELYSRLINEKDKRPLVKNLSSAELKIFIGNKLKERDFYYRQAKIKLKAALILPETINTILENNE